MPKVLRIINRFNLGGPTYNAAYLTKHLPKEYQTRLIGGQKAKSEAGSEFILEKNEVPYEIIHEMSRSINPFQDIIAYRKIKSIIKEYKPDIVHTHASKAGTIGRLAAWRCKVPVVVHTFHGHVFHSYFNGIITFVIKSIERFLAKKTTKIIAISAIQKHELTEIHKIAPASKVEVIHLGFDLQRFSENTDAKRKGFRDKYQLDDATIAIGIIGRLAPIKNHELFLHAIAEIDKKTTKKIRTFIIGDGDMRTQIEQKATELGLKFSTEQDAIHNNSLVFTSWIKEIDIATSGLDIIALSSKNEGTPVSLIEAQAANKPIVSTRVGGIENIVKEGETALLSDKDSVDEFTQNLLRLIENDELRQSMGANASDFVNKTFSYQRLVSDIDSLYKELLLKKKTLLD